ncbi:hypothetical protein ACIHCV_15800 [Streptomyces sp. NPDC051956]|uniref:hypothetical protein n=1 Tax=Streptomyces sp. NPDC051956 TaxID=3365677 RepID=UPI0037D71E8F
MKVNVALGVVGLVSIVLMRLSTGNENFSGVISWFERGAVYPITAAELIAGVALLHSWRSGRTLPAEPSSAQVAA